MGNASHAFGTAKALEMDIESGAFSSIGMILTAVISSVVNTCSNFIIINLDI